MTDAQKLVASLNAVAKSGQFDYKKARATARADKNVDWSATKARNADFNPEVDGCESFVMRDGSVCTWIAARYAYAWAAPPQPSR
jgi:hypothetical protein